MLSRLGNDIRASLVVFLVSLPICLGSALVAGLPVSVGLISGVIGGIVVGAISGSRLAVSGPVPGVVVIAAGFIDSIGSVAGLMLAIILAGILQIILGLSKGASIGDYFPSAVIKGVLAGIGLQLISKQLPQVIALSHWQNQGQPHLGVIIIGSCSLICIFLWDKLKAYHKFFKLLPAGLFVVIVAIVSNSLFFARLFPSLYIDTNYLIGHIFSPDTDQLWGTFFQFDWSALQKSITFKAALVIAAIASLLSVINLDAADSMDKGTPSSKNREMLAQGVANVLVGLFGGLPVISSALRSATNKIAGNESRLSAILHGVWLALCFLLIPQVIALIPLASLSALLVFIGIRMNSLQMYRQMFKLGKSQFLPFIVTTITCAFVDFLTGIGLGMAISIFFIMKTNTESPVIFTSENGRHVIRIMKDISFLNRPLLRGILDNIPDRSEVVLDNARPVPLAIDRDIINLFEDFFARCKTKQIKVSFRGTTSIADLDNYWS